MNNKKLLDFFILIGKLKKIKRSGWKISGVKDVESIADHSFRLAVMTLTIGQKLKIDLNKAVKIALVHDIPEAITGDIVTWQNYHMKEEKKQIKEKKTIMEIKNILGRDADEIIKLHKEYSARKTKEAQFVWQLDKLECILQAMEYKKSEKTLNKYIDTFFENVTTKNITHPALIDLLKEIQDENKK